MKMLLDSRRHGPHGCGILVLIALLAVCAMFLSPLVHSTDNGKVTLQWTAPGDPCDDTLAQAAEYDIRYSTMTLTEQNWTLAPMCSNVLVPGPVGSEETYTVVGLKSNTLYYFAVKSADSSGNWSAISNVVSKRTGDLEPPISITDLSAVSK
jgi:hypothetical protein